MLTVLIPGVGSEGALGIIKGLRAEYGDNIKLIGLDTNQYTAHKKFLDLFLVPPIRSSNKYYPFILDLIKELKVDVFWPLPTTELEFFSLRKKEIEVETNCKVLIGEYKGISIANNKKLLYEFVKENNLGYIAQYRVANSYEKLKQYVYELGYPQRVVCIKTINGSGSRGFRILDKGNDRLNNLLYSYPNNTICWFEDLIPILKSANSLPEMIVMEYLPGDEFDVDVLCYDGKSYYVIPRLNKKMHYGMSIITETVSNKIIEEISKKIVKSLKLSYIISLSFKLSKNHKPCLLEINPRVPGTIISTVNSGINLPQMALQLMMNNKIPINKEIIYGTTTVRYWEDCVLNKGER